MFRFLSLTYLAAQFVDTRFLASQPSVFFHKSEIEKKNVLNIFTVLFSFQQRHSAEAHSPCQECYPWFTEAAIEGKRQPLICASGGESQLMKWIPVYPAVGPSEAVVEEESVTNHKLFCTTRSWGRSSLPTIFFVPSEQGARAQVLSERARRHCARSTLPLFLPPLPKQ